MNKYFKFLDELRDSGNVNMFAASPHLKKAFPELSDDAAITVLLLWIHGKKDNAMRRTVDSAGKIEIPEEVRNALNLEEGSELVFKLAGDRIYIQLFD